MGLLMNLFGQSFRVRYEGVTYDGQKFTGTAPIKVLWASWEETEIKLKAALFVDSGIRAKTFNIVGAVEIKTL